MLDDPLFEQGIQVLADGSVAHLHRLRQFLRRVFTREVSQPLHESFQSVRRLLSEAAGQYFGQHQPREPIVFGLCDDSTRLVARSLKLMQESARLNHARHMPERPADLQRFAGKLQGKIF